MMRFPGATMSGFITWSMNEGPRLLYVVIRSSARSVVFLSLNAPTVRAAGVLPGLVIVPYPEPTRPRLPAETTTRIPAFQARVVARDKGSVRHDSWMG